MHTPIAFRFVKRRLLLWLVVLLTHAQLALAGPEPASQPNVEFRISGTINTLVRLDDGSTVVGGLFDRVDGQPRQNLARILADGSLDPAFSADANGPVNALLVRPDGRLFVGGGFTQIDGQNRARLALIDLNGDVDASFQDNNTILLSTVSSLALSADGQSIYVGGSFNALGYNRLAKLALTTGVPDANFKIGFAVGQVRAIAVDGTGGLFIGGTFRDAGGNVALDYLARVLDNGPAAASVDAAFTPVVTSTVHALGLDATHVYVGGSFVTAGNPLVTRNRLAKFARADGALDASWNPNSGGTVRAMRLVGPDLYVGGSFRQMSTLARVGLARVDAATGTVSAAWGPPPVNAGGIVNAMATTAGTLVAAGSFTNVGAATRVGLAEIALADASLQAQPDAQASSPGGPVAVLAHPDGSLWVGGNFALANGLACGGLVRILADGSVDPAVAPVINGTVHDLEIDSAERVYVVGDFSSVNGQPHERLARFASNGTLDAAFTAGVNGTSASGTIYEAAIHDHFLYVGGWFTSVGTSGGAQDPAAYVAKLDTDTGLFIPAWTPVIPPPTNKIPVQAMAIDPAGALFIGGGFTSVDGSARLGVAKLALATGDLDAGFVADVDQVATGQAGDVWGLAFSGGQLYIGGIGFTSINATPGFEVLARVSGGSGALDTGWDTGLSITNNSYVETVAVQSPTRLLVAGGVLRPDGGPLARFRLDASTPLDPDFSPVLNSDTIHVIYRPSDQTVVTTGSFTMAGSEVRTGLAAFKAENLVFEDGFED